MTYVAYVTYIRLATLPEEDIRSAIFYFKIPRGRTTIDHLGTWAFIRADSVTLWLQNIANYAKFSLL